jgi:hypothetical protein
LLLLLRRLLQLQTLVLSPAAALQLALQKQQRLLHQHWAWQQQLLGHLQQQQQQWLTMSSQTMQAVLLPTRHQQQQHAWLQNQQQLTHQQQ